MRAAEEAPAPPLSQGRAAEAAAELRSLYDDLCVVYGSGHGDARIEEVLCGPGLRLTRGAIRIVDPGDLLPPATWQHWVYFLRGQGDGVASR